MRICYRHNIGEEGGLQCDLTVNVADSLIAIGFTNTGACNKWLAQANKNLSVNLLG